MFATAALALLLVTHVPPDSGAAPVDSSTGRGPVESPAGFAPTAALRADSTPVRPRARAVEVSEWYERRLRIHRYGSYAMYPLFALQAVAGNQLYVDQRNAPAWAKTTHRVGATGLAAIFTSNTVTGVWNLWDSRAQSDGRARRYTHALLMLASDAGFTYAGARLSEQAENSSGKRREHRTWAYGSMASALLGVGVQLIGRN